MTTLRTLLVPLVVFATTAAGSVSSAVTLTPTQAAPAKSSPSGATSDAALKDIRAQIAKGQFKEALTAIAALPASAPVLRLKIEAAIGARDFATAITTVDELRSIERKEDPALMATIARTILEDVGRRPDPLATLESCKALLAHGTHACAKNLTKLAANADEPLPSRLTAAATLAAHGDAAALAQYKTLAAQASAQNLRAVVSTVGVLPPATAVPLLQPALASTQADIQYAAASRLGDLPSAESRKALTQFLASSSAQRVAMSAARLSLARLGDETYVKDAAAALPQMQGGDLLELGIALMKRGDPQGLEAVTRATRDDRELVRIAAAAALSERSPDVAKPVFMAALQNANPLIRAAALEEFRTSPMLSAALARGLLLDSDPLVQIRAADALLTRIGAGAPKGAAAAAGAAAGSQTPASGKAAAKDVRARGAARKK